METQQADNKISHICGVCSKHFKSLRSLNHHEKTHTSIKQRKCRQCPDQVFNTSNEYLIHLKELHHSKLLDCFICSKCGKQFKSKSELTNHINSKCGTIKLYKCEVCSQKLMTAGSLYNHMLRHKGDPSYMCRYCAKLFLTAGQLKVHERIHTQDKVFVCHICGKGFCHRQSLITHSTLHTGIKPYLCENCGHSFSCVGNLLKHRKTHADCGLIPLTTHRVVNPLTKMKVKVNTPANSKLRETEKQREKQKQSDLLQISRIENTLDNEKSERNENSEILIDQQLSATKIMKSEKLNTLDENNSQNDSNITHNVTRKINTEINFPNGKNNELNFKIPQFVKFMSQEEIKSNKRMQYKYCTKTNDDSVLTHHRKESYEELNITCDMINKKDNLIYQKEKVASCGFCQKSFTNKKSCENHLIIAHNNSLTCQDCNKTFLNPDLLQSHRNTSHQGIARKVYAYVCEHCGKQFKQKSVLIRHSTNKCSDGPSIQCQVCEKKFSSVHVLKSHMRIHNSEKKLLCKFCGKSFHWKGQLKIHERSHTGEKPFTCLYCPKAFAYRESLITHSSLHTGIKPHLCEACGWRFSCVGNLIKHKAIYANTCGLWYSKQGNE